MADYKDEYYAEVDNLFADIKRHPFEDGKPLLNPAPHEDQVPGPAGWVENADGTDGTATVKIDADGLTITDGKLQVASAGGATLIQDGVIQTDGIAADAITAAKIAAGAITTSELNSSAVIQNVTNSGATVTINSSGITVTDGAISVENGSGTVIIDGSSNMFKIVASGTMSVTQGANTTGSAQVSITGAGLPTWTSPAFVAYLTEGTTPDNWDNRDLGRFIKPRTTLGSQLYAASASGGAVNVNFYAAVWQASIYSDGSSGGTGNPAINIGLDNADTVSRSATARYHILKEEAI